MFVLRVFIELQYIVIIEFIVNRQSEIFKILNTEKNGKKLTDLEQILIDMCR